MIGEREIKFFKNKIISFDDVLYRPVLYVMSFQRIPLKTPCWEGAALENMLREDVCGSEKGKFFANHDTKVYATC